MEPGTVRLAAIASGRYDGYLSSYAEAVRAYRHPVILSFGHEMNGFWYPWGYGHTSPGVFVAAWRHIVRLFRAAGADNVTWLWTVNVIHDAQHGRIPSPDPWWPGSSYVTWVGIDGYYFSPSGTFAPLFGPTIAAVRELTRDPILVAETAAAPAPRSPPRSPTCSRACMPTGCWGWSGSTPADRGTGGCAPRPRSPRSARAPRPTRHAFHEAGERCHGMATYRGPVSPPGGRTGLQLPPTPETRTVPTGMHAHPGRALIRRQ